MEIKRKGRLCTSLEDLTVCPFILVLTLTLLGIRTKYILRIYFLGEILMRGNMKGFCLCLVINRGFFFIVWYFT